MSNTINTASIFAKEALKSLRNSHVLASRVHRAWQAEWAGKTYNGYKPGATVSVTKPAKFTAVSGATISAYQDTNETNVDITVDSQFHVPLSMPSTDKTLKVTDFRKRFVDEAIIPLNEKVNNQIAALYKDLHHMVGTPGTTLNTFAQMRAIRTRFEHISAPEMDRVAVYDPTVAANLANGLAGYFQPTMVEDWLKGYALGRIANIEHLESVNIVTAHTGGAGGGTPLVKGASQTGASIITDGWTISTAILKKGDIITFADVNDVNPRSYQSNGYLKQFVVTADVSSDGAGEATIAISPSIVTTGARQNVDAGPANNAAITIVSGTGANAHTANMAFTRQTFSYVCVPMEVPEGAVWSVRETSEDGLSIRVTKFYDGVNDKDNCRVDILTGYKTTYPETGIRVVQ